MRLGINGHQQARTLISFQFNSLLTTPTFFSNLPDLLTFLIPGVDITMWLLPHGILFLSSLSIANAYTWPSPQYEALEAMLYEGQRPDGSSLASLVHPCKKRVTTLASVGAEWLRFVRLLHVPVIIPPNLRFVLTWLSATPSIGIPRHGNTQCRHRNWRVGWIFGV